MIYQRYEPVDPRDAFSIAASPDSEGTQDAAASQAAFLLSTRAAVLGVDEDQQMWREDSKNEGFELPELAPLQRTKRMKVDEATQRLGVSTKELASEKRPALQDEMTKLVHDMYDSPSLDAAAALFEGSMRSDHPLVAVAGAAGARETTRMRSGIGTILEDGCNSDDPLVAGVARAALGQIRPTSPYVRERVGPRTEIKKRDHESHTAVITHGTWASANDWYKPDGNFHDGLSQHRNDVHDPSFTWSGGYSHGARRLGAIDLENWLNAQQLASPDFYAHSHGGTVVNLATHRGLTFDNLVLMSWPVHQEWFPDFDRVADKIIDIRVRMDLVILADRGGQRFRPAHPKVIERRNGWFNHFVTRESEYWDDNDLWGIV